MSEYIDDRPPRRRKKKKTTKPAGVSDDEIASAVEIMDALYDTGDWVRMSAVAFGAVSFFQLAGGLSMIILSLGAGGQLATLYFWSGAVLLVGAGLAVFPVMKLFAFVRCMNRHRTDSQEGVICRAFTELRLFWQYVGILAVLDIAGMILVIVRK